MVLEMDFLSMMDDAFDAIDDDSDDMFDDLVDMDIITAWHFSKTKLNKQLFIKLPIHVRKLFYFINYSNIEI